MKLPRNFFKPLAAGAPAPLRELPVRLERMIHFVPPHIEKVTAKVPQLRPAQPPVHAGVPSEVVAAVSAALAVVTGPHRILHIAESKRTWSHQGRIAQHSHQPRH